MKKLNIVCIGEILWDSLPLGLFLGGAPFNVAYHLNKLGADVKVVSRVGDDDLGHEALKRTTFNGMSTDLIQIDYKQKTGFVDVKLGADGIPVYNIKKPVAWDYINQTEDLHKAIMTADAIVFGTLAQRMETSKGTIQSIANSQALKVLDLNLRAPYDDKEIVLSSLYVADLLKVNINELNQLKEWYNLPPDNEDAAAELTDKFELKCISITLGEEGSVLYVGKNWVEADALIIDVVDTVGAGDAFLAALIIGYLNKLPPEENLKLANRLGAYAASCYGGTPEYAVQKLSDIETLPMENYT